MACTKFVPLFSRYYSCAQNAAARFKLSVQVCSSDAGTGQEGLLLEAETLDVVEAAAVDILKAVDKAIGCNYFVGFCLDPERHAAVVSNIRAFQLQAQAAAPCMTALAVSPWVGLDRLTLCLLPLKLYNAEAVVRTSEVLATVCARNSPLHVTFEWGRPLGPMKWVMCPHPRDAERLRHFAVEVHAQLRDAGLVAPEGKLMCNPHVSLIKISWDPVSKAAKQAAAQAASEMKLTKKGLFAMPEGPLFEGSLFGDCTFDTLRLLHIDGPTVRGSVHAIASEHLLRGSRCASF
uniref:Uncharacterized protein n=1 Tax=Eutreptiella gymnastica TaxID=73025 RepID=A0A7S1JHZ8_9EUGL|mmetsp:Transcript_99698/g.171688  ORF Transcript_99698/g.171688 Transcript_99698/m.171688 type:complete len:291 (+) Transcript_99698:97-969(+)